jgi:hypothetical protein
MKHNLAGRAADITASYTLIMQSVSPPSPRFRSDSRTRLCVADNHPRGDITALGICIDCHSRSQGDQCRHAPLEVKA